MILDPFGRRPKRQRTPTTMYTDDQPGTYTKKGEPIESKKPSFYFVEDDDDDDDDNGSEGNSGADLSSPSNSSKRSYRRRKPYHKDDMLEKTTAQKLEELAAQERAAAAAAEATSPPVKRKRGRPPKKRPPVAGPDGTAATLTSSLEAAGTLSPSRTTAARSSSSNNNSNSRSPSKTVSRGPSFSGAATTRVVTAEPDWTPPQEDKPGEAIAHKVQVHSIVEAPSLSSSSSWEPLYQPDVYFDADYEEGGTLPADLPPVTREISCLATRKPHYDYLVMGDTMGFVTIYSLGTHIRPIVRLETVACQQRAREEQDKIREQYRRKKKTLTVDATSTQINALGMIGERVVLATACELECLDVPSQTSLWVCPLGPDRLVTYLDMHPTRYDVLVSCKLYDSVASYGQTSPLMLLQHAAANVEVCDANAPILLKSPCCTAIWDQSKHVENRLLFVAVSNDDLELVLVQGGSIDNWKVVCKTRIPVKSGNHETRLQQSAGGTYTLVASSRGIRLYQTETLQLIHVYGDQLALHGQSVVWKDCLMMMGGAATTRRRRRNTKTSSLLEQSAPNSGDDALAGILEYEDWLQEEEEEKDQEMPTLAESSENDLGQYIVGVPQKGPKELTETLHVWKVEQASVVPAISMPLPPKSDGVQALIASSSSALGDRLVLATQTGEGYCLQPKMESNFAGIMYPAGYQVITDNVDYMEKEDELDQVVAPPSPSKKATTNGTATTHSNHEEDGDVNVLASDELDDDLREALRQSLLEQQREKERHATKDEDVDVISPLIEEGPSLIPCRPEAYLRQAVNSQPDDDDLLEDEAQNLEERSTAGSPVKASSASKPVHDPKLFVSNILESLGHANPKKHEGAGDFSFSVTAKVVIAAAPVQAAASKIMKHGKKSRAANLESMLKASIDPRLQRFMFSKQACGADGRGSRLRPSKPKDAPSSAAAAAAPPTTTSQALSLQAKMRQDENDVALGLLGLSPSPANGHNHQDMDMNSDTASRTSSNNTPSFGVSNSKRSSGKTLDPNCYACRGRHVIHTCGTRALPIDFDEVAKQERLRREQEEEEKKKARAEKRRLADQRRREARKQKMRELEDQRRREAEEVRLEKERVRRLEEASAAATSQVHQTTAAPSAAELERQRREMIVASYAKHMSHIPAAPAPPPAPVAMTSINYTQTTYQEPAPSPVAAPVAAAVTAPATLPWERSVAPVPATTTPNPPAQVSSYSSRSFFGLPNSTTLDSADALVALAGLAGIKADQQEATSANGLAGFSAFCQTAPTLTTNTTATTSHGFGATPAAAEAPKRSIPSFAAIRGQESSTIAASRIGLNGVASKATEGNGNGSASFVWPPQPRS